MTDDLVSIIIPTHFRNEGLQRALRSVREQDYSSIEVIVVDDSGEGHARDVIKEFEDVLYIRLPDNRGAQAARNAGLRLATGEYVWFFDDDDQLRPTAVSKQIAALHEHPNAGAAICGIEYDHGDLNLPSPDSSEAALERSLEFGNTPWRYSTVLVKRSVLDNIVPLDEAFEGGGDMWMRIELAQITECVSVEEPLVLAATTKLQVRAGEEVDHLGFSWASLEARWKLLDRYGELYDDLDPDIRRHAMRYTYRLEGLLYLQSRPWSPRAILAFARAAYYAPTDRVQHVAELAVALFGRSGHRFAQNIRDTISQKMDGLRGRE